MAAEEASSSDKEASSSDKDASSSDKEANSSDKEASSSYKEASSSDKAHQMHCLHRDQKHLLFTKMLASSTFTKTQCDTVEKPLLRQDNLNFHCIHSPEHRCISGSLHKQTHCTNSSLPSDIHRLSWSG